MADSDKGAKKNDARSEGQPQGQSIGQRVGVSRVEAQAYYERGLRSFATRDYEDALADLDAAIQRAPGYAELYSARGWIGSEAGKKAGAEEDFQYALQLSKRQWLAHYGLGVMAFDRKKWEEAITHFSEALKVAPGRPEPWYYRAVSYYNSGEPEKARADMRVAARWFTDDDSRAAGARNWLKALGDNSDGQHGSEKEAKPAKGEGKESAKEAPKEEKGKAMTPQFGKPAANKAEAAAGESDEGNETDQAEEPEP